MKTTGSKYDTDKDRLDLVPWHAVREMSKVLTFGSKKYGEHNWRNGIAHSRLFAAAMRHLTEYWNGETLDTESGLNHLSHAMTNIAMMIESSEYDDRHFKCSNSSIDSIIEFD